ncbi:hypothetical protein [Gimesia aquarii]|uniref:Uncharacterized protein n=1 Tax=Gimesia aquarii TaxID=2527964 RepID=A0A517WST4_9PLAN|nr:hypothetical protein [Gimesia aquarii]QDU08326.1 hypothetical protein V202x_16930 [Gimesia aquarii]
MSKRRTRMMYAGGGVLALGIILGQYFGLTPGINSGSGEGEEKAAPGTDPQSILASTETEIVPVLIQPEPEQSKSQSEAPLKVLDILIDNRSYFIKAASQPKEKYRRAEIVEIISQAKKATGNEDGIHIRVYRKGSARVIPESLLKEELKKSGLSSEMIDWKIHLVD